MNRKRLVALVTATVLTVTMSTTGVVYAQSTQEKRDQLRDQIESVEDALSAGRAKANELVAQITQLNGQIEELEGEIANTKEKIAVAEENLAETQTRMSIQNDSLNARLRTMYMNGETDMLEILLGSANLSEFLSNIDMVQRIYNNDMDVLGQIQAQYDLIEQEKNDLEALNQQLSQQQAELSEQKSNVEELEKEVESNNEALEAQLDEMNAEADRLTEMLLQQQAMAQISSSATSVYTGGVMLWPVPGNYRISSQYGYRIHPILHTRNFHSGLDIPAATGTSIVAASAGTVIFSGTKGGYGKCVMIDHGGGIVTLYGHCSALVAGVGESVSQGQTIARVGSTGQATGPHCHFEVRINGSTTSPVSYLQG